MVGPTPRAAAQARDPSLRFRTIETEHFEIHYHEPLGLVARRIAAVAEDAHRVLAPALGHTPRTRVQVVVTDLTDSANGSASAIPYNAIRLYVTAPDDLSPLGDYDDWMTELVVHEHTHVLHLDNIGGIPGILNAIFGKIYAPNQLQPRWFIEGLATYHESRETAGGRLRSTLFDMYLRMDALEGRLLSLSELSNSVDRWPHGNVWYLYGSRFVHFISQRYGQEALAQIAREYGRQAIPYGLNRIARRATGQTFVSLYRQFLSHARAEYRAVERAVIARGRREGQRLTSHGESTRAPRFLDPDTIVYGVSDGRRPSELRLLRLDRGKSATLTRAAGSPYPAPTTTGDRIYFSAVESYRDVYFFNDLFVYERTDDRVVRLTHGLRAREPSISPDGKSIAFTVNRSGTTHLVVAETKDIRATERVLVRNRRFEQIFTPRFSPDGTQIAFSVWRRGGYRDIEVVDVRTGEVRAITRDRALDTGPEWSNDGAHLFFSSDRTGIANIYRYEIATGELQQVTNVVGGAYQPAISPDGRTLVYVGYTSRGFDLYRMPLNPARFLEAPDYVDTRPPPSDTTSTRTLRSRAYDPLPTLLPRAYRLDLETGPFGQQAGVSVTGQDVVGFHAWSMRLVVPFERPEPSASLAWTRFRPRTPLTVSLYRQLAPRGGLVVGGQPRTWIENALGGDVGISYPIPRAFWSENLSLGYSFAHLGKAEPFGGILDPNDPPPIVPETGFLGRLRFGWSYSSVLRQIYDISPSSGHSVGFGVSLADPVLGGDFRTVTFTWTGVQYVPMPWLRQHVLAVRLGGGISGGDLGRRGVFGVGGFPQTSLVDALIDQSMIGGVALRGYAPFSRAGTQYHLLQSEYRFLLLRPQLGLYTFPFYVNRMYANVFADYGDAFFGRFDLKTFRAGVGGEILTDFTVGYFVQLILRTGLAYGLNEGGGLQYYLHLGAPF